MRRKTSYVANAKQKATVYTCALLALGVYAVPRLPQLRHGLPGTFSFLWLVFAGLAIASNLYFLFGADKERAQQLSQGTHQTRTKAPDNRQENVRRRQLG